MKITRLTPILEPLDSDSPFSHYRKWREDERVRSKGMPWLNSHRPMIAVLITGESSV